MLAVLATEHAGSTSVLEYDDNFTTWTSGDALMAGHTNIHRLFLNCNTSAHESSIVSIIVASMLVGEWKESD